MLKFSKNLLVASLLAASASTGLAQEPTDLDAFFRAVTDGRSEVVAALLSEHPQWSNRELFLGIRPLYRAAVLGRPEVTQLLLESGADVTANTDRGTNALHAASQNGHLGVVLLLLASKAPVDARSESGATPLHLAARYKRDLVLSELLRNGADPNLSDEMGRTPLHYAAGLGQPQMVTQLVQAGADFDAVDKEGYTPLGWSRTLQRNSYGDVGGYLESKGAKDERPPIKKTR